MPPPLITVLDILAEKLEELPVYQKKSERSDRNDEKSDRNDKRETSDSRERSEGNDRSELSDSRERSDGLETNHDFDQEKLSYHLTGPLVCNALYGLQGLQPDIPPVRRILRALARELNATMPSRPSTTPSSLTTPTDTTTAVIISTSTAPSAARKNNKNSSNSSSSSSNSNSGVGAGAGMGVDTTAVNWPYVDAKV